MTDTTPVSLPDWTALLAPLSMRQVAAMPWRCPELACTPGSRARLQRWALAGCPTADPMELVYVGSERYRRLTIAALRRFPPPLQHHIVTFVPVFEVGHDARGWCASPILPTPPPGERLQTIMMASGAGSFVDDADYQTTFVHEAAHAWLLRIPQAAPRPTVDEIIAADEHHGATVNLACEWGMLDRVTRSAERDERQAADLTRALGFHGPASHAERCADGVRRRILSDRAADRQGQEPHVRSAR